MPSTIERARRNAMGGAAEILIEAPGPRQAEAAFALFFESIETSEQDLSHYRPTSEISRINRLAGERAITTDAAIFDLLDFCLDLSRLSGGGFDITVGPLVRLYRENPEPDAQDIARARARVGWRGVELVRATRTVRLRTPGLELDLGAVGKGWALDRAARELRVAGVERALIGLSGSSWLAVGAPRGAAGWRLEISTPFANRRPISRLQLAAGSLSTSGQGTDTSARSHLLDPRTGSRLAPTQVSVLTTDAARSDALSTTLAVLGRSGWPLLDSSEAALLLSAGDDATDIASLRWPSLLPAPG